MAGDFTPFSGVGRVLGHRSPSPTAGPAVATLFEASPPPGQPTPVCELIDRLQAEMDVSVDDSPDGPPAVLARDTDPIRTVTDIVRRLDELRESVGALPHHRYTAALCTDIQ